MESLAETRSEPAGWAKLMLEALKTVVALSGVATLAWGVYQWNERTIEAMDNLEDKLRTEWRSHISTLFDHPELYQYFYDKKPTPSEEMERARVLLTADIRLETIDNIIGHAVGKWTGDRAEEIDPWRNQFKDAFRNSRVLCERFILTKEHYDYIDKHLEAVKICEATNR
jgi:hypothetical protein